MDMTVLKLKAKWASLVSSQNPFGHLLAVQAGKLRPSGRGFFLLP